MIRLRLQMAVLVIALISAGTQCAAKPCHGAVSSAAIADESVPPCHRHPAPKQTETQESCKHSVLVSDNPTPLLVSGDPQGFDFTAGLLAPPLVHTAFTGRLMQQNFSPPRSFSSPLLTVLRV